MERTLRYDHYKVLGIPRDASQRRIKQAYREMVKAYHPDRNPAPNAAVIFQVVHEAYVTLCDPASRAHYDERLRFYREANGETSRPTAADQSIRQAMRDMFPRPDRPPTRFQRLAFIGLHVTGLLFGISTVAGILICVTFLGWSPGLLVFSLPGIMAIPASLDGLMRPKDA